MGAEVIAEQINLTDGISEKKSIVVCNDEGLFSNF